jgi:hypothetical protein
MVLVRDALSYAVLVALALVAVACVYGWTAGRKVGASSEEQEERKAPT